jgi:hypothetical protein
MGWVRTPFLLLPSLLELRMFQVLQKAAPNRKVLIALQEPEKLKHIMLGMLGKLLHATMKMLLGVVKALLEVPAERKVLTRITIMRVSLRTVKETWIRTTLVKPDYHLEHRTWQFSSSQPTTSSLLLQEEQGATMELRSHGWP